MANHQEPSRERPAALGGERWMTLRVYGEYPLYHNRGVGPGRHRQCPLPASALTPEHHRGLDPGLRQSRRTPGVLLAIQLRLHLHPPGPVFPLPGAPIKVVQEA